MPLEPRYPDPPRAVYKPDKLCFSEMGSVAPLSPCVHNVSSAHDLSLGSYSGTASVEFQYVAAVLVCIKPFIKVSH